MQKLFLFILLVQLKVCSSQEMYKVGYNYTNKNNYTCMSNLYTNNKEAVFEIDKGTIKTPKGKNRNLDKNEFLRFFYANKSISYYRFIFDGLEIIYKDEYPKKIEWIINTEKKKLIGKYNCTEAKINLNGRFYTAWFTYDIPVQFGPLKLHQLPGLIVEVTEDNGFVKLALNSISKTSVLKQFNLLKQFYNNQKKVMNYCEYENKIVQLEIAGRLRSINIAKKMKWSDDGYDDSYELNLFLEIPTTLGDELKKQHK